MASTSEALEASFLSPREVEGEVVSHGDGKVVTNATRTACFLMLSRRRDLGVQSEGCEARRQGEVFLVLFWSLVAAMVILRR